MKHIGSIIITGLIGAILLYISRFWIFPMWSRNNVLAELLHPNGHTIARWLRGWGGPELASLELIIWVVIGFLILSAVQKIYEYFNT